MPRISGIFFLQLGALLCLSGYSANIAKESVIQSNSQFAFDMYRTVGKLNPEKETVFSPYSVSSALAMTWAGSLGKTETDIARALRFTLSQKEIHPEFQSLNSHFYKNEKAVELIIANQVWGHKDYRFKPDFLKLLGTFYEAQAVGVDFIEKAEQARKMINLWVETKTKDRIKELIASGLLDARTRMVLTNAIYFKGLWESAFHNKETKTGKFNLSPGKQIDLPFMNQSKDFPYNEQEKFQLLELPYKDSHLTMLVILPKKIDGLPQLESQLSPENLQKWVSRLTQQKIILSLPKFRAESSFRLDSALSEMGMASAFTPDADFSGMGGKKGDLYLSAVVHKAFVDISEEGTEAAAATAVVARWKGGPPPAKPITFIADRPFIYLIRDRTSGTILFIGSFGKFQKT